MKIEFADFDFEPTPEVEAREAALADLSEYDHALHQVDCGNDVYDQADDDINDAAQAARNLHVGLAGGANVFSSALIVPDGMHPVLRTGQHTIALDLDFPAQVVEGGGKTVVGLDYLTVGIKPSSDGLTALVYALYDLNIGAGVGLSPRGLFFETPHRVRWAPSSTPGHGHLYIDAILWWDEYEALLQAFAWAGLVEPGYVGASMRRKATHLRLPWVRKDGPVAF